MFFTPTLNTKLLLQITCERTQLNRLRFEGKFPSYGDGDHAYHLTANQDWLASFWSGLLWWVALESGEDGDLQAAKALLPSFEERLTRGIRLNHDLGFLFTLSAVAAYKVTGDLTARALALQAAELLLGRYRVPGNYIQAWGAREDAQEAGRFIIDCMMNLPLLFWASEETGNPRYAEAANGHAQTSLRYLLRADGSTYHTYYLNPETGAPIGGKTHQGYADESLWSRGQAWAVYGFAVAAQWTANPDYAAAAQRAADCYQQNAPADAIIAWDVRLPADVTAHPDSSAEAIAAGGFLRLAVLTGKGSYRQYAERRLNLLYETAFDRHPQAQGLLLHGTQHAPHHYGVDTYTIFGDYFFLEAVMALAGHATDFWGPTRITGKQSE